MAQMRTAERQLPPAATAGVNAAARVSCGFLSRSLESPACLLSLRSVSEFLPRACAVSTVRSRSLSFFRADSPVFSHCPEQRLPHMAPAIHDLVRFGRQSDVFWTPRL
jgi:hypothetical protein